MQKTLNGLMFLVVLGCSVAGISQDDDFTNVGPRGIATQSSEGWSGNPQRALDGNTDGQWGGGSVTHTNGAPSWWEVDLRDTYEIWSITIWNRLDCCSERLTNFTVTVLDSDSNVIFEEVGLDALSQENFELPEVDAEGQFVRISMPEAFLSLAEVEIFSPTDGLPPPPPPPPPLEPLEEGVNPNGWIRSNGWNMLFLDQDGGCGGGGFPRMEGNWVAPYDLAEENPRPGDEWEID
ncbi:MAG: discoidin domain-containing protein, partial [Planctomycetes bacterium]|nr:discoidin domain-containing protein [Planctomycetota bacterium]